MVKLPHLILDLHGCDPQKLSDINVLYDILDRLPDQIEMQKVSPPILFNYQGGITGFVVVSTSHIAIHTFPDDGYVFLDVFSCKDFDTKQATEFLAIELGMTGVPIATTLYRGQNFTGKGLVL